MPHCDVGCGWKGGLDVVPLRFRLLVDFETGSPTLIVHFGVAVLGRLSLVEVVDFVVDFLAQKLYMRSCDGSVVVVVVVELCCVLEKGYPYIIRSLRPRYS